MEDKHIWAVFGIILLALLFSTPFRTYGSMQGMMYNYTMFSLFGWLLMVLVIILLVLAIAWFIRQLTISPSRSKKR